MRALLYEWDQLKKRAGLACPEERLSSLDEHREPGEQGRFDGGIYHLAESLWPMGTGSGDAEHAAFQSLGGRRGAGFSPICRTHIAPWAERAWLQEKVPTHSHILKQARHYPENLGEGKHLLTLERDLDYLSGLAAQQLGDTQLAQGYWKAAAAPLSALSTHSYFQAQAMRALGDSEGARAVLREPRSVCSQTNGNGTERSIILPLRCPTCSSSTTISTSGIASIHFC